MTLRFAVRIALLASMVVVRAGSATTCVQTMGPGCPSGATRLCDAEKIEDVEARTRALAAELPSALCSTDGDVRTYAFNILRYSRELDLTLFRDALLCSDRLDAEADLSMRRSERAERRRELIREREADPESVSESEIMELEGDPPRRDFHPGEELLERWEWAHADRDQRIPVYAAAIERGVAPWRRVYEIGRDRALRDVCARGLSEVRPQVETYFGRKPPSEPDRVGYEGCRALLGLLDNGAPPDKQVESAFQELSRRPPVELDREVNESPAMRCAMRSLNSLAQSAGAKSAREDLHSAQRPLVLIRLSAEQREQVPAGALPWRQDSGVLGMGLANGCLQAEPQSPCGWGGW
jgi:hypothetical protein